MWGGNELMNQRSPHLRHDKISREVLIFTKLLKDVDLGYLIT